MDQNPNPSSSRADRKTIEKNRRNQMKALYSNLIALLPQQSNPREMASLTDQLEGATNYIKTMQTKLETMKRKKNCLMMSASSSKEGSNLPKIDVRVTGSVMEVVLVTGLNCHFMFSGVIRLLHEEGAEVVDASFSTLDDTVFHTIHSKIGDGGARISERLRKFVYEFI